MAIAILKPDEYDRLQTILSRHPLGGAKPDPDTNLTNDHPKNMELEEFFFDMAYIWKIRGRQIDKIVYGVESMSTGYLFASQRALQGLKGARKRAVAEDKRNGAEQEGKDRTTQTRTADEEDPHQQRPNTTQTLTADEEDGHQQDLRPNTSQTLAADEEDRHQQDPGPSTTQTLTADEEDRHQQDLSPDLVILEQLDINSFLMRLPLHIAEYMLACLNWVLDLVDVLIEDAWAYAWAWIFAIHWVTRRTHVRDFVQRFQRPGRLLGLY